MASIGERTEVLDGFQFADEDVVDVEGDKKTQKGDDSEMSQDYEEVMNQKLNDKDQKLNDKEQELQQLRQQVTTLVDKIDQASDGGGNTLDIDWEAKKKQAKALGYKTLKGAIKAGALTVIAGIGTYAGMRAYDNWARNGEEVDYTSDDTVTDFDQAANDQ